MEEEIDIIKKESVSKILEVETTFKESCSNFFENVLSIANKSNQDIQTGYKIKFNEIELSAVGHNHSYPSLFISVRNNGKIDLKFRCSEGFGTNRELLSSVEKIVLHENLIIDFFRTGDAFNCSKLDLTY